MSWKPEDSEWLRNQPYDVTHMAADEIDRLQTELTAARCKLGNLRSKLQLLRKAAVEALHRVDHILIDTEEKP